MTGYYLRVGYNSSTLEDLVWKKLVKVVEEIRKEPTRLIEEAVRLDPEIKGFDDLEAYALMYQRTKDETIVVDEDKREIRQYASGGSTARQIKEAFRRAFCRLVIEEMHRKKMEVNLTVS